jgi:hypothetical protein
MISRFEVTSTARDSAVTDGRQNIRLEHTFGEAGTRDNT